MNTTKATELKIHGEWITAIDHQDSLTPTYVEKELNHRIYHECLNRVHDGGVILDIGAHVGIATCLFGKKFPKASIIAVEPNPDNIKNFHETLAMNKIAPSALIELAISNQEWIKLWVDETNSGACVLDGLVDPNIFTTVHPHPTSIPGMSLNRLFEIYKLTHERISLMKLDIEGSEYSTLKDFTYWDNISMLMFEVHWDMNPPTPDSPHNALSILDFVLTKMPRDRVFAVLPFTKYYAGHYGE